MPHTLVRFWEVMYGNIVCMHHVNGPHSSSVQLVGHDPKMGLRFVWYVYIYIYIYILMHLGDALFQA